jgi:small-conductance mechanosensitive channel
MAQKASKKKVAAASGKARKRAPKKTMKSSKAKRTTHIAAAVNEELVQQTAELHQMPFAQEEASDAAMQASETLRQAAENMMKTSSEMMQQFMDKAASPEAVDASKEYASEQASSFGADSYEHLQEAASMSARGAKQGVQSLRENIDAMMACANVTSHIAKQLSAHMAAFTNHSFNQKVALSKQALSCRTLNHLFDLGNDYTKTYFDNLFAESIAISQLLFQGASDITDPVQERFNETATRTRNMMHG